MYCGLHDYVFFIYIFIFSTNTLYVLVANDGTMIPVHTPACTCMYIHVYAK